MAIRLRAPRLALMLIPGLDHFAQDIRALLPAASGWEIRGFGPADLGAALAWADDPVADAIWFEFCWPPFPRLIGQTEFGGRRVIVRVHRIEAYGTSHAAVAPWEKITDAIVVSAHMAGLLRAAAPAIDRSTRITVVHNGVDLDRFAPLTAWDRFRIGWCGLLSLHKNPILALQILVRLREADPRYTLHCCAKGGDPVVLDSVRHLTRRLGLVGAVRLDGTVAQADMPGWHARNGLLLSTSLFESFGYAIAEAAAVGCDLAVLDYPGAEEFWPAATRFAAIEDAVAMIRTAQPMRWRPHVEAYSLQAQMQALAALLNQPPAAATPAFRSAEYWEARYAQGGTSGAGSSGRLAAFKAGFVNRFVRDNHVASVIEFGCGDGRQLALADYPSYVGTDVAPRSIALCRDLFAGDETKRFLHPEAAADVSADLALSLDVIYHLVEDAVFERYMRGLFAAARRFVIVYASDRDAPTRDPHVRHRRFTDWVARNAPDWRLTGVMPNPYGFDPARPGETSFSDFHVFARQDGAVVQQATGTAH